MNSWSPLRRLKFDATSDHTSGVQPSVPPRRCKKARVSATNRGGQERARSRRRRCGCVRSLRLMSDMLAPQRLHWDTGISGTSQFQLSLTRTHAETAAGHLQALSVVVQTCDRLERIQLETSSVWLHRVACIWASVHSTRAFAATCSVGTELPCLSPRRHSR